MTSSSHEDPYDTRIRERLRNPDSLLTSAEVAHLFRVDRKTVSRWATANRIRSVITPGGHKRFRADEVNALLLLPSDEE